MGISIRAVIDPSNISPTAWADVYDETVAVLRRWPDPPIRPARRTVAGVLVVAYTRDVVDPDGWHICGDANSRLTAESIELPRELRRDRVTAPSTEGPEEILLRVLSTTEPPYDYGGLQPLLNNKTQGRPFHLLVLAVAMLIEHRLPHAAFIDGDFTPQEAQEAQSRLRTILDEEISLPVCTQPSLLHARLKPHLPASDLDNAVQTLMCRGSAAGILLGLLNGSIGSIGAENRQEIEHAVACTEVASLDPLSLQAFDFMIGQAKTLFGDKAEDSGESVRFPSELLDRDRSELLATIANGTSTTYLRLTEMAWDDIEHASLPELRLLAMLATHHTPGLVAHQLRRAIFESAAIRRHCASAWETVDPVDPLDYPWQARMFEESRTSTG